MKPCIEIRRQGSKAAGMGKNAVQQHKNMGDYKGGEDRRHHRDGFLDSPDVKDDQQHRQHTGHGNLVLVILLRNVTEHGIHAGGDGYGDSQHIVHQQGTSGDNPRLFPQHVAGHDISAAAMGKMLDDAGVGVGR